MKATNKPIANSAWPPAPAMGRLRRDAAAKGRRAGEHPKLRFMWADTRKLRLFLRRCGAKESYKENQFQEQQPGAQQAVAGLLARTKALINLSSTSLASASTSRPRPDRKARASSML